MVDSQLSPLVGGPGDNAGDSAKISNHAAFPMDDGGARDGVREGYAPSARGWQQQPSREGLDVAGGGGGSGGGGKAGAGAGGVGVGAEGHFILGLSTEAFGSTPVDEVAAWCCLA